MYCQIYAYNNNVMIQHVILVTNIRDNLKHKICIQTIQHL